MGVDRGASPREGPGRTRYSQDVDGTDRSGASPAARGAPREEGVAAPVAEESPRSDRLTILEGVGWARQGAGGPIGPESEVT